MAQECDLVCDPCSREPERSDAALVNMCEECFRAIDQKCLCEEGILGHPEILNRESELAFEHHDIALPEISEHRLLEVQPVEDVAGKWLACTETGVILEMVPTQHSFRIIAQLTPDDLDFDGQNIQGSEHDWANGPACVLQVSHNGELVAVANRYGRKGIVLDTASGKVIWHLLRDEYHEDVSSFPLAFVRHGEQLLLIHGTEWNRLDVSDAKTGRLLTEREPTSYTTGEDRPEHYLDYFHCSLLVSPDQRYVADNGWVWHPLGCVECWSVEQWVNGNVWESEDGESKKSLSGRVWYWDGPLCWIDDHRLAVWGYGGDVHRLIPAACIFDVRSGKQERWFAGPKGSMVYDEYLFSYDKEDGIAVWVMETGERVLRDSSFCPVGYHRGSKQFLSFLENHVVRISRLVQS